MEMLKLGSTVSGTIAPLAIAGSPAFALTVETTGCVVLKGQIVRYPGLVGPTNVTFRVAALAVLGIPQAAGATSIGKFRATPDDKAGPPVTPVGPRVSTIRHGVIEKN